MGPGIERAPNVVQIEFHNLDPDFVLSGDVGDALDSAVEQSVRTGIPITTKVRIEEPADGPLTRLAQQSEQFRRKQRGLLEELMQLLQEGEIPPKWYAKLFRYGMRRVINVRSRIVARLQLETSADALHESKRVITQALNQGKTVWAEKRKWLEFEPVEGVERGDLKALIELGKRVMVFVYRRDPETRELVLIRDAKVI